MFVTILCSVMSVMIGLFFLYHLLLALDGATTNERQKRSDYLYFYENKKELLVKWLDQKNDSKEFDLKENLAKKYKLEKSWTKQQIEHSIKRTEELIKGLEDNPYYRGKWQTFMLIMFPN